MNHTRIYITGCGSSGNTLMRRCFYAFKNTKVLRNRKSDEVPLVSLLRAKTDKYYIIGKRTAATVFSRNRMWKQPEVCEQQIDFCQKHNIRIINMVRDGRDVVTRTSVIVRPRHWIYCMRQRQIYPDAIDMEIRYEDLVRYPDQIQKKLMAKYGFKARHLFSEYPVFVPQHEWKTRQSRFWQKQPRPIDTRSIGKAPEEWRTISRHQRVLRDFEIQLRAEGYL
jgi:hypothetical protein